MRLIIILIFLFLFADIVSATDFSSTNFTVRDPVIEIASSTEMSSVSFRLTGSIGQMSIGTSTSVTFEVRSGFLYFPKVTVPVLSATAGDGSVSLSWTASQGFLGWNVSGYNVGQATVSGGPYTYTPVGNVLSSVRTGLTNGAPYYFIVRPEDAFGNSLATSSEVSGTPAAGAAPAPAAPPSGGGGGIILELLKQFGYPALPSPKISDIRTPACPYQKTDLNCDGVTDLQDLSIYLYLSSDKDAAIIDFNSDRAVDIADLSVLFSDWSHNLLTFSPDRGKEPTKEKVSEPESGFAFIGEQSIEDQVTKTGGRDASPQYLYTVGYFFLWIFDWVFEFFRYLFRTLMQFLGLS